MHDFLADNCEESDRSLSLSPKSGQLWEIPHAVTFF